MLCSGEIEFSVNLENAPSNELTPGNHRVVRDDARLGDVTSPVTCLVSNHHTSLAACQYQHAKVSTFKVYSISGPIRIFKTSFLLLGGPQSEPMAAGRWSYSSELVTTPPTA
jgi:hypothetical protein